MPPIAKHYERAAYDFLDVVDLARDPNAAHWGEALLGQAIAQISAYFPKAAQKALGSDLVASYKAQAEKLPIRFKVSIDVIDQALERGRMTATEVAKHGPDGAIADDIDRFFAALAKKYGVAGSSGASATLTDSGDQSKLATKTTKVDPLVAAIQSGGNWDGR